MPSRRPAIEYPEPVRASHGPWKGCREQPDVAVSEGDELATALNMVPADRLPGTAWRARPGFRKLTSVAAGGALAGAVRAILPWSKTITYVWAGTTLYEVNDLTGTITAKSLAGVTVAAYSSTLPSFLAAFAGYVIGHDSTNRPWKWDPLTNTASNLTGLSAPVYGPPAVYYGKLFFVLRSGASVAPTTEIVWSEEADPNTGYNTITPANSWVLQQTSQEPITALQATNEALYYWRRTSIGQIAGAVTDDFTTSGTNDSVSLTVGATSPASFCRIGEAIWFVDQMGVQRRLLPGGQIDTPGDAHPAFLRTSRQASDYPADVLSGASPEGGVVVTYHPALIQGVQQAALAYGEGGTWIGRWAFGGASATVTALGTGRAVSAGPTPARGGGDVLFLGMSDGHLYALRAMFDADVACDTYGTGVHLPCGVDCPPLGFLEHKEVTWDRLTLTSRPVAAGFPANLRFDFAPSAGALPDQITITGGTLNTSFGFGIPAEEHVEVGLDVRATRFLRLRVRVDVASSGRFAPHSLTVDGTVDGADPGSD